MDGTYIPMKIFFWLLLSWNSWGFDLRAFRHMNSTALYRSAHILETSCSNIFPIVIARAGSSNTSPVCPTNGSRFDEDLDVGT